jgi:hypothetical protein
MIGQVELTEEQIKELKEKAIKRLEESMKDEFIQDIILQRWGISHMLRVMNDALYFKTKDFFEKPYDELDNDVKLALAVREITSKIYR